MAIFSLVKPLPRFNLWICHFVDTFFIKFIFILSFPYNVSILSIKLRLVLDQHWLVPCVVCVVPLQMSFLFLCLFFCWWQCLYWCPKSMLITYSVTTFRDTWKTLLRELMNTLTQVYLSYRLHRFCVWLLLKRIVYHQSPKNYAIA